MAIHTLSTTQIIRASLADAWSFFSDPRNLSKITPPEMGFETLTSGMPSKIHPGMVIEYRVRPLAGIPISWLTEITHVIEGQYFVDEQRVGPYAIWHHEHSFRAVDDHHVEMADRVTYRLPFQPFGEIVHRLLVRPQLDRIFAFREQVIRAIFES